MKLKSLLIGVLLLASTAAYSQTITSFTERGDSVAVNLQTKCLTIHLADNDSPNANISMELDSIVVDQYQLIGYSKWIDGIPILINSNGDTYFYTELTSMWGY